MSFPAPKSHNTSPLSWHRTWKEAPPHPPNGLLTGTNVPLVYDLEEGAPSPSNTSIDQWWNLNPKTSPAKTALLPGPSMHQAKTFQSLCYRDSDCSPWMHSVELIERSFCGKNLKNISQNVNSSITALLAAYFPNRVNSLRQSPISR